MKKQRGEEPWLSRKCSAASSSYILPPYGSKATSWYCYHSFMLDRLRSPSPRSTYSSLSLNPYRHDLWEISVINEYLPMGIIGSFCCSLLNDEEIKMVGVLDNPTDDVYDNSKPCQYCGRYQWACDNSMFGPHTLVYFDRGRARHWVRTCRDCANANAKQQFSGPAPHTKIPTQCQKTEAWHAVFNVIIEQQQGSNKPIALVEATKIAASRNETVKDYFGVSNNFSEYKCSETFLELIHYFVTYGLYLLYLKNDLNRKGTSGGGIQIVSHEPIITVKYIDAINQQCPSCPNCKCLTDASPHYCFSSIISTDAGKFYYCNNPLCAYSSSSRRS